MNRNFVLLFTLVIFTMAPAFTPGHGLAQGSSPTVKLKVEHAALEAGGFVTIVAEVEVAPDAASVTPNVTIDPREVGADKFVRFMTGAGRWIGCASGTLCYGAIINISVHTRPGTHRITASTTDSRGRTGHGSIDIDITPPRDVDGDGLPDRWEAPYNLSSRDDRGVHGAQGDPDGDGISNLEEFQRQTNPIARFVRLFAEGSYGERQVLRTCFTIAPVTDDLALPGPIRVLTVGDGGRTKESFFSGSGGRTECPLGHVPFVADRIVAVAVESVAPVAVERSSFLGSKGTLVNASFGVQGPSRTWHFARGGAHGDLDLFFLTFNPNPFPVAATFEFRGGDGQPPVVATRTLTPNVRTTIWVDREIPAAAASDMAARVTSSAPVLVERAWRYRTPGATAPHDSVTRGWTVPSTRWYFAAGDLSAAFDTSFAIFNPSDEDTIVDAEFLFADRDPGKRSIPVAARSRIVVMPRQLGIGGDSLALMLHARGGVGVIAERTVDAVTRSGAWRQSVLGATAAGARWVFAEAYTGPETDILIANPSDVSGRARLHFRAKSSDGVDVVKFVDVPARRVVRIRTTDGPVGGSSWLIVTSEASASSAPPIVVERVTYADADDVRRSRQATIFGNLQ